MEARPMTQQRRIYLDYNASTPLAPQVADAMRSALDDGYGNPSSGHWAARPAKDLLERSRGQVAALLGCGVDEIVFTSGGSEANNLALKGLFFARASERSHIIISAVEHPSVLEPCRFLEKLGARITQLPVDRTGRVDPDDLRRALTADTLLVSVMHANNEVGTIEPIAECARVAREHGVPFHTDAAQSVGKIRTSVDDLGVDLLTIAGHKLYAPKGVGALYVRAGIKLESLIHGAGHETGRRAGTESALLASALGAACTLAQDLEWTSGVRELRDHFWSALHHRFGDRVVLNGHPEHRLPNTLNVSFVDRVGTEILAALNDVAASTGSACHSGRVELSPVLRAMKVPENIGGGAVRFSLGRATTREDIDEAIERICRV
jgi:cysteine desulfurase